MLSHSDLTENQLGWIHQLSNTELQNFFLKYRRSRLASLDSAQADPVRGLEVQHEIAALYRLEQQFKSLRPK